MIYDLDPELSTWRLCIRLERIDCTYDQDMSITYRTYRFTSIQLSDMTRGADVL